MQGVDGRNILKHTVDGSEIRRSPPGISSNPVKSANNTLYICILIYNINHKWIMGINYNSLNWWGFSGSKTATLAALDPGSFKNRCWTGWIRWDLVSCNPIKKPEGSRDLETQPWGPGCFWLEGSSALFWGVKKRPSKTFGGSNTFTLNRGHGWVLGMSQKIRSISPIISIILWPGDGMFRPSVLGEIGRDLDS